MQSTGVCRHPASFYSQRRKIRRSFGSHCVGSSRLFFCHVGAPQISSCVVCGSACRRFYSKQEPSDLFLCSTANAAAANHRRCRRYGGVHRQCGGRGCTRRLSTPTLQYDSQPWTSLGLHTKSPFGCKSWDRCGILLLYFHHLFSPTSVEERRHKTSKQAKLTSPDKPTASRTPR